jgi:hypothetical protein
VNVGMETVISVLIGVGLAAACGFRVFLPLCALSIAAKGGHVPLSSDFAWVASNAALVALATASVLEIVAYYVPWMDHALDVVATPAAVFAGVMATAAVVTEIPPVVRWGVAVIAGGGIAGAVQGATVLTRLKSGVTTGGLANPVVATGELVGSAVQSFLAIVLPILALVAILVMLAVVFTMARRVLFGRFRGARRPG